jgi:hypothetical protein
MPGLVWEIFGSFIAILLLMTVCVSIVAPLLYFVAGTTQNKTMAYLAYPGWRDQYDANAARDRTNAGWLAVGFGFPVLAVCAIIAYALREQGEKQEEEEQHEVPEFTH